MGRPKIDVANMGYEEIESQYSRLIEKFASTAETYGREPEDIAQELRIKMFQVYEKYNAKRGASFITFLYTVFTNYIRNEVAHYKTLKNTDNGVYLMDEMYEDDTSFVDLVGHSSLLTQDIAFAIVNEEDYRDIFSEEEVDLAFTELAEVLRKENE